MTKIWVQISSEAKAAYFAEFVQVAMAELQQLVGKQALTLREVGPLAFIEFEPEKIDLSEVLRCSFAQGIFEAQGELLRPLDLTPSFLLHEDFVFGSKFKGKTNERLTQMLLNVGRAAIGALVSDKVKVLDPMCGRATTLLWAMRYGMDARGIEQDKHAIEDVRRNVKKWCKVHRQKHQLNEGTINAGKKKSAHFLEFATDGVRMKLVTGDAREADTILNAEKFDLIVSDLPYGVQHTTHEKSRNPLALLKDCAPVWKRCLKDSGALVLSFNSYSPPRKALIEVFENAGFSTEPFAAEHRMSESIVRDVVVFRPIAASGSNG